MDWIKNPALLPLWEVLKKITKELEGSNVSLYLTPLYRNQHLVLTMPQPMLRHKTGKCTLRFFSEDDTAIEHLPKLLQDCLYTWVDAGIIS